MKLIQQNVPHTPGPYIATVPPSSAYRARYIEAVREEGPNVVIAEVCDLPVEDGGIFAAVANASLFRASPDLLSAVRLAERNAQSRRAALPFNGCDTERAALDAELSIYQAAIAAARGEG